jgi:hypothetical protein
MISAMIGHSIRKSQLLEKMVILNTRSCTAFKISPGLSGQALLA